MKCVYLIVLYLHLVYCLYAQEGFVKAYNINNTATLFNNMMLNNDTIVLIGINQMDTFPFTQGVLFCKMDTNGVVLSYKLHRDSLGADYSWGGSGFLFRSIKTQDGSGYLLLGHVFQRNNWMMMKVNKEGEQLWVKEYPDTNTFLDAITEILETDNGILLSGIKQKLSGQIDISLLKTDKQGNLLWEKSYGLSSRGDYLNSFLKLNDNEYILAGHTEPNADVFNHEAWHHQIQIFAVDSLGNEKWRWESEPPVDPDGEADMSCRGLHRDEAGNWIYMTMRGEHEVSSTGNYQGTNTQAQFVVRDSNFNIIVEREYDDVDAQNNYFHNMIQLSDGDWFGVGANSEKLIPPVPIPSHRYAWMNRISSGEDGMTNLGDSLWTRKDLTFPDSNFQTLQHLHSAVELPSGNIIAAGYFSANSFTDHGILIKVNQHGCIDYDTCAPTNLPNVIIGTTEVPVPEVKVYPNPTSQQLHILSDAVPVWDKIEVLDITGRVMKTVKNNNELTLEHLASGVYVLRLWKDGSFYTQRVVRK
jgi:Secretion system C-terminal sorting domain